MDCFYAAIERRDFPELAEYSILEIFRNILDHSEATKLAYCAQFCPSQNKIEVAIIDNGIEIKKSLSKNPYLKEQLDDQNAIEISLLPGISDRMYKGIKEDLMIYGKILAMVYIIQVKFLKLVEIFYC